MSSNHRLRRFLTLSLSLVVTLFAVVATALESDREQPIDIEADGVEIDDAEGVSIYQGNVTVSQGSMRMQADRVTVYHRDREPTRFVAEGDPVRFRQLPDGSKEYNRARARRAEYELDSEVITLTDGAELIQGGDTFASERIVYDRVKSVVRGGAAAKGEAGVKIRINTRRDKEPAD